MYRNGRACSYLAFDVYFAESGGPKTLEQSGGLADLYSIVFTILLVGLLFDDSLGAMGLEEFTTRSIVVEAKLVSEEAESDIDVSAPG